MMNMKVKAIWVLLIIIVAQLAVLSLFHYDSTSSNTNFSEDGYKAEIVVAKMDYIYARVDINAPYVSWAEIVLPDGSTHNITGSDTFTTFFAGKMSWSLEGSISVASGGTTIELNQGHPIDVNILNDLNFYPWSTSSDLSSYDFYNITIITPYMTTVNVQCYGVST